MPRRRFGRGVDVLSEEHTQQNTRCGVLVFVFDGDVMRFRFRWMSTRELVAGKSFAFVENTKKSLGYVALDTTVVCLFLVAVAVAVLCFMQ